MLVTTIWLGALGFADDYIKVFRKNKEGTMQTIEVIDRLRAIRAELANIKKELGGLE